MAGIDKRIAEIDSGVGGITIISYRCQNIAPFWKSVDLCGPWWRLYRNYAPGGTITIDGKATDLRPDHVYLIPPFARLTAHCAGNPLQFFIHFTTWARFELPRSAVYSFPLDPATVDLIGRCFSDRPGAGVEADRSLICLELTAHFLRLLRMQHSDCFQQGPYFDPRIELALNLLWNDPDSALRLANVAAKVKMSPDGLIRLFRKTMDMTPMMFRKRLRLYSAAQKLISTGIPIDQIAEEAGYQDRFAFTRAFHQQYGTPPAEFRKQGGGSRAQGAGSH